MSLEENMDKIVHWYTYLKPDYLGVNMLMNARQSLSGYLVAFSSEVGEQRKIWNLAKAVTERTKMYRRADLITKNEPIAKAEAISRAESIDCYDSEVNEEAEYYRMYYKMKAYHEVLSAMSQQIAFLREELVNVKRNG